MFKKVLVANRGEVALRVMRACKELGIQTVAVYSTEDANTYPVEYADEKVCIGPAPANQSYLVMASIIAAAKNTGAEAIHPGYGFLAENAEFARACAENDIVFIGPSPSCIERMGNKAAARDTMKACGVPTVPGSDGVVETPEEARRFAEAVGYPVLVKASAGGGGKGMREVHDPADLESQFLAAKNEAQAAFGNGDVYLEKLVCVLATLRFKCLLISLVIVFLCVNVIVRYSVAIRSSWKKPLLQRSLMKSVVQWALQQLRLFVLLDTKTRVQSSSCLITMGVSISWR